MISLETKVRKCYESAPFPDNLRKAKDFDQELQRTVNWIKLNLEFLSSDLPSKKFKKILCAGCGTGEEALALAVLYPKANILAIDISRESLKIAKQNAQKAKIKNITFTYMSILDELIKHKQKYDFIYSAGVIHHLAEPLVGFQNLVAKLNSNGKIVIMLYNSYGLFLYKCQLKLLQLTSGNNLNRRLYIVNLFSWGKNRSKAYVYDTYINPQVKTFTIEQVKDWAKKSNITLANVVPPLDLNLLINYALSAKEYVFRRKELVSLVYKLVDTRKKSGAASKGITSNTFSLYKTIFFQLIYLVLGKGECQFLFTKP